MLARHNRGQVAKGLDVMRSFVLMLAVAVVVVWVLKKWKHMNATLRDMETRFVALNNGMKTTQESVGHAARQLEEHESRFSAQRDAIGSCAAAIGNQEDVLRTLVPRLSAREGAAVATDITDAALAEELVEELAAELAEAAPPAPAARVGAPGPSPPVVAPDDASEGGDEEGVPPVTPELQIVYTGRARRTRRSKQTADAP